MASSFIELIDDRSIGEGRYDTIESNRGWTPQFLYEAPIKIGEILAAFSGDDIICLIAAFSLYAGTNSYFKYISAIRSL